MRERSPNKFFPADPLSCSRTTAKFLIPEYFSCKSLRFLNEEKLGERPVCPRLRVCQERLEVIGILPVLPLLRLRIRLPDAK
jgi:hypothetical protein